MSINKFLPHVLILPEDDANRQIANGFIVEVTYGNRVDILPPAGGWTSVYERFLSSHVAEMRRYPARHMVLLLDFDDNLSRRSYVLSKLPEDILGRVFLLGAKTTPEELRTAGLGTFEQIGKSIGAGCRTGDLAMWSHALLIHNEPEVSRLRDLIQAVLFR